MRLRLPFVALFCLLTFVLVELNEGAAQATSSDPKAYVPTVIMDPNHIEDADLSSIVIALSRAKRDQWRTIRIHQSIFGTLSQEFSFADGGPFPWTARALASEVAKQNGITDLDHVAEGAPLLVPPLPSRPSSE